MILDIDRVIRFILLTYYFKEQGVESPLSWGSIFIQTNSLITPVLLQQVFKIIPVGSSGRDFWWSLCMLVRVLFFINPRHKKAFKYSTNMP